MNTSQEVPASLADEHHQAKKEGKLERFMRKHGLHEIGTEPQDDEQQNDPRAILFSGGMTVNGPVIETKRGMPVAQQEKQGGS